MKIKLTIGLTAALLTGCASTPSDPNLVQVCGNISQLYAQSFDLRSHGASKSQAIAFMYDITKDIEPTETREFILLHAQSSVNSVYDNPKISRDDWQDGIKERCYDKPPKLPAQGE